MLPQGSYRFLLLETGLWIELPGCKISIPHKTCPKYNIKPQILTPQGIQETSCKSVLTVNMKNKFHSRKFVSTVKNGLKLIENHLLK
jgi:hypothetical protein